MKEENSYRQIFKALSVFGGLQVIVIFFGIIRTKFIAVIMGPSGVGTIGLYTTVITFMVALTSFGIGSSGIKIISESFSKKNDLEFKTNLIVLNKLSNYTSVLGVLLTCILSSMLSKWTFGNYNHTISFIILSLSVLFIIKDNKNLVLLQSTLDLKAQSKATLYGALLGTTISLPLYFFFREDSIVYTLLMLFGSNMLFSYFFSRKINYTNFKIKNSEIKSKSKEFINLGIAMTLSYILVVAVSYIIRLYISQKSGVQEVGLYQAGWAIVNGYVGLLFTAMAKDYYPRLSAVNFDNSQVTKLANQQIELGILILAPVVVFFLFFMDKIIQLLYSSEFITIKNLMIWSLLGMFFKLLSWSISYIFLSKGLSKKFMIYEIINNVLTIFLSLIFYEYYKLDGLGYAFLLINIIYLIIVFYMAKNSFGFSLSKKIKFSFCYNLFICTLLCFVVRFSAIIPSSVFLALFISGGFFVCIYSAIGLNKSLKFL